MNPPGDQAVVHPALRRYLLLFLLLAVAGWAPELWGRAGLPWISGDFSALLHPHSTFVEPSVAFTDLTGFSARVTRLGPATIAGPNAPSYPPGAVFVLAFLLRAFDHPVMAYLIGLYLCLGVLAAVLWRSLCLKYVSAALLAGVIGATLLLGYPQIFAANRGNIEWINWALTAAALLQFTRRRYLWMAVLLGLSMSIKPFPVVLLLLLLWRRRYLETALSVAVTGVVTLAAFYRLGPTVMQAFGQLISGSAEYTAQYIYLIRPESEFRFNHSLLDGVKVILFFVYNHEHLIRHPLTAAFPQVPFWARLDLWSKLMTLVTIVILAWIWKHFRPMPAINQIFALAIAVTLLPQVSGEYTLLIMYIPWAIFLVMLTCDVATGRTHLTAREISRILVPSALLFSPMSVLSPFTGFGKMLTLIYLLVQVARMPLPSSLFGELDQSTEKLALD